MGMPSWPGSLGKQQDSPSMPFLFQEVFGPETSICWQHQEIVERKFWCGVTTPKQNAGQTSRLCGPAKAELSRRVRETSTNIPVVQSHTEPPCLFFG